MFKTVEKATKAEEMTAEEAQNRMRTMGI